MSLVGITIRFLYMLIEHLLLNIVMSVIKTISMYYT